ncbi:hypothetical protein BURMUCGD2M_5239 [Burkholderia multivorans CGD2M]|uniref:Uncharacterized protein n=1 Tax=Burkholderia multivorans CGD2 TaxID=513052 RepID=B9BJJ1_9BURK|nr:hypothetical protein BURMUCGD2_5247 [Burkholderia multivorans CGD2]EEE15796.1 hypothetical protein BURMUCGD2M_5239 [Burkholderia multivorans CGD2M]
MDASDIRFLLGSIAVHVAAAHARVGRASAIRRCHVEAG